MGEVCGFGGGLHLHLSVEEEKQRDIFLRKKIFRPALISLGLHSYFGEKSSRQYKLVEKYNEFKDLQLDAAALERTLWWGAKEWGIDAQSNEYNEVVKESLEKFREQYPIYLPDLLSKEFIENLLRKHGI